jgi:hypothetical protein
MPEADQPNADKPQVLLNGLPHLLLPKASPQMERRKPKPSNLRQTRGGS